MNENDVLNFIWDNMPGGTEWGATIYPDDDVELYLTTPEGVCYRVTAKHHPHLSE